MRLPRSVAVLACAAVALASCSSGAEEATVPTTTVDPPRTTVVASPTTAAPATTAPPTTTTLAPEAAVLAAYEEYRTAQTLLFTEPDLASPAFETLMTGRQRELIRQRVQDRLDGDYRTRYPTNSLARRTAVVETMMPTAAVVISCSVDDSYRLSLATGEIRDTEVKTFLFRIDVVVEDGRWKVEWSVIDRTWDGVAGCAV